MFYEGSEKRLEITTTLNLLNFEPSFWHSLVEQAGAYIISEIKNEQLTAFLLSESSLFVWKHKLLLITCGETHLLQAALFFQKKVARKDITSLLFQRHQGTYPERQKSSFQQDSLKLQQHLNGDSRHWRENYCGDIFLFGNNQHHIATKNILMLHQLTGDFFEQLRSGKITKEKIIEQLKLNEYFSEFNVDHYCFEPKGYSLNAISGEDYFTLHITPEKLSSYISFESSLSTAKTSAFHRLLLSLCQPKRSYLMTFTPTKESLSIQTHALNSKATQTITSS
ncbi:S-adenosylmethionine decarboxylase [Psychromonas sp. psych-6C06]|uniref:S-adenosylmethionine decarboxylase n=1 Tax=Psychromonas sp. psych-6C06 TaxID=2058089 RepID=UPI000C34047F|nr:S-adenosylmethionine decarboxylase [Psychromonas sp. psych-6C06]PKF63035.1 S-adenosylmethionine decarboxylase [Psychromonas sp. psych-6C06]